MKENSDERTLRPIITDTTLSDVIRICAKGEDGEYFLRTLSDHQIIELYKFASSQPLLNASEHAVTIELEIVRLLCKWCDTAVNVYQIYEQAKEMYKGMSPNSFIMVLEEPEKYNISFS